MPKKRITITFGTRPEAIKLAPVIEAVKARKNLECQILATAQHRDLLDQMLDVFEISPDGDLDLMTPGQTLDQVTSRVLLETGKIFDEWKPDMVIVQGDTTTVFAAALAAFYRKIRVGHVEAGLRAGNRYSPFPEEINRRLAGNLANLHFAPTQWAAENLLKEGLAEDIVFMTGNPVIDAVKAILERTEAPDYPFLDTSKKLILMTAHRRESFGQPMRDIFQAVVKIAKTRDDIQFVYPVHPNPNVREAVKEILEPHATWLENPQSSTIPSFHRSTNGAAQILLLPPLSYIPFVHLMGVAHILLTDSGGIQEEGAALGKPVLVLRENTERPEAVEAGAARLLGTDQKTIVDSVNELLDSPDLYESMSGARDVFGDGKAGERIARIIDEYLSG